MRYALTVQYRGKCYSGSQIQFENGKPIKEPTIQYELEKAISTLIFGDTENKNRRFKTVFSGRTDKGVNSLGQVVHFDTDKDIVASKFVY
jgi:tRNA pseudouridine(38-40) synthase